MATGAVPVPPAVAEQARAALTERDRRQAGGTRSAVLAALELAVSPVVPLALVRDVYGWHQSHVGETNGQARTLTAGLWGGAAGRDWAGSVIASRPSRLAAVDASGPVAAGIAIVAEDTGRVLMLQRALNDDDPASGKWEFPGGHIDDGEGALEAARREFAEEVGIEPQGRLAGDWLSADGVYHGFIYVVASEADVDCNMPTDDREVLNPDDPDGDAIEVVAWWDVNDAADNPAVRAECLDSTPWDDLRSVSRSRVAAIGEPLSIIRDTPISTTRRDLSRLSQRLAKIDSELRERAHAGAQVAVTEALRQAGVKLRLRARKASKATQAALDSCAGRYTPPVLAAVGITEAELLDRRFDAFGERFRTWAQQANKRRLEVIADELDVDVSDLQDEWGQRMEDATETAVVLALAGLGAWARQLLADPEPVFDRGEQPLDPTLPAGVLRPALAVAEGRQVEGPGRAGVGPLAEGELRVPPSPGFAFQVIAEAAGPVEEVLTWVHGGSANPFEPHLELDGSQATYDTLESVWANNGDWPPETFYYPGDHLGDSCFWESTYETAGEAG